MEMVNGEQSSELLGSQAHIWNHIFSFINSMSPKCAMELEIPDVINNHGRPMTNSQLINALPINKAKAGSIYRLMRILVHSGFFVTKKTSKNGECDVEEEGYLLAPASRLLLKDHPLSLKPFVLAMVNPDLMKPWDYLAEWFHNERQTAFEMAHGRTVWEYAGQEPRFINFLNHAMASDARLVSSVVIDKCKGVFEGLHSLVDVGGGTGTMAKAIAEAFPHLKCTNFDLPQVVDGLEGSKNLSYVAGNMLDAIPPADAVLLKWILHDWNDEECVKILKKCKEAIPSKEKGGKVIIIDMVLDNRKGDDTFIESQLFFDMMMMVMATGRERTKKDWAKVFQDAGFSGYKITPAVGLRSLIQLYP